MHKNVFIKSMLRQPVRFAVLVVLIAAAAFAFTMRMTEYMIVSDKIDTIARFYRSVGFLRRADTSHVLEGADIVANSPHVAFEDRRRGAQGRLVDMVNANVQWDGMFWEEHIGMSRYITSNSQTFLYGELLSITYSPRAFFPHVNLLFQVDHFLTGYAEHRNELNIYTIRVHYYLSEEQSGVISVGDMIVGQRYFLRTLFRYANVDPHRPEAPNVFTILHLAPGSEHELWYIPVEPGEFIDYTAYGWEWLHREIEEVRFAQSTVQLRTTADMTAMPAQQITPARDRPLARARGRWINHDDYLNANPVVVVHDMFLWYRDLEIGDTITIALSREQRRQYNMTIYPNRWDERDGWGRFIYISCEIGFTDHVLRGVDSADHVLELEIVGTFRLASCHEFLSEWTVIPQTIRQSWHLDYMFIPDSLLPDDIVYHSDAWDGWHYMWTGSQHGFAAAWRANTAPPPADYLPAFWYSFVLNDARLEDAFLRENRDLLAAMGYEVLFIPTGAENFFASAEPILFSALLNTVMFVIVLILVLALVVFLYLRQNRREFAILRALGKPAIQIYCNILASVILLGIPAVSAGGIGGWFVALNSATNTLNPFAELVPIHEFTMDIDISVLWLFVFLAAMFAGLLVLTIIGAAQMGRTPVLELLQGVRSVKQVKFVKPPKESVVASEENTPPPVTEFTVNPTSFENATKWNRMQSFARHIFRHIVRTPAKTALIIAVTAFFIVALGFLRETIDRTEYEIGRLYDTIHVRGSVGTGVSVDHFRRVNNVIRAGAVQNILDSGFTRNEYIEASHEWAMIAAHNNPQYLGFDPGLHIFENQYVFNALMGFNEIALFYAAHSRGFLDEIPGIMRTFPDDRAPIGDMHIEFAPGFGVSDFAFVYNEPLPVILSEQTIIQRGLSLGDEAYILHTYVTDDAGNISPWATARVIVIGTHNRNILAPRMRDAVLIPLAAMEYILEANIGYSALDFYIEPLWARELDYAQESLRQIAQGRNAGWVGLDIDWFDDEMRTVVGSMEQNLAFLRLLYPAAIALSFIIAVGLSLLIILQNAKNAAILRVLGSTKTRTRLLLCVEKLIITMFGAALGFTLLPLLGVGFATTALLFAGLYLTGTVAGAVAGAVIISDRAPMELLQVRE